MDSIKKSIFVIIILYLVALSVSAVESNEKNIVNNKNIFSFSVPTVHYSFSDKNPGFDVMVGGLITSTPMVKLGFGFLIAGISCDVVGGALLGSGYAIIYYYTTGALGESILAITYGANTLISLGFILAVLSVIFIPGIILMAIGAARGLGKHLTPLPENIGFSIQL